jgi:hypothetical protein
MTAAVDAFDTSLERRRRVFLDALGATLNVSLAARRAGVTRQCVYQWREREPGFAAAWQALIDERLDDLEAEAFRRAMDGSDMLLWRLLATHRREVYGAEVRHRVEVLREQRVAILVTTLGITRGEAEEAVALAERALAGAPQRG